MILKVKLDCLISLGLADVTNHRTCDAFHFADASLCLASICLAIMCGAQSSPQCGHADFALGFLIRALVSSDFLIPFPEDEILALCSAVSTFPR